MVNVKDNQLWRDSTLALFAKLHTLLRPPPQQNLVEWAEENRILTTETSAQPGPLSFKNLPFMREIANCITDPRVERVIVMGPSRVAKTECLINNGIGYSIDRKPGPILVILPSQALLNDYNSKSLEPMLRETPVLRDKVGKHVTALKGRAHNAAIKQFLGGSITLANANSAESFRNKTARDVYIDDCDAGELDVEGEGDLVELASRRAQSFTDRKIVVISSPTTSGASLIEQEYEGSTREVYLVPCPNPDCQLFQDLNFRSMNRKTAELKCITCKREFRQHVWQHAAHQGVWHAYGVSKTRSRSFKISGLLSPWIEWEMLCALWDEAVKLARVGQMSKLKTLKNTMLGELWLEEGLGEKLTFEVLQNRREVYTQPIPEQVLVITVGVDTQDHYLVYSVFGWGLDTEAWLLDYGTVEGDPEFQTVWDKLDESVYNRQFDRSGDLMKADRIFVDYQGHKTDFVYNYTRNKSPRVYAIRGDQGDKSQIIKTFPPNGKMPFRKELTVDSIKSELATRLKVATVGPSFFHFPMLPDGQPAVGADNQYFVGLTSEYRRKKKVNNLESYFWYNPSGVRNESWDTLVYAYGALLDLGGSERLRFLYESRYGKGAPPKTYGTAVTTINPKAVPHQNNPFAPPASIGVAQTWRKR